MILQALVQHYEDLAARGEIAQPGWGPAKISYALDIDDEGRLLRVISVRNEQQKGKKTVLLPQEMQVPAPVKRSSGVLSNFLWDNSSYVFGADRKGKPKRSRECFRACGDLHRRILGDVDAPAAKAVLAYFSNWEPEGAEHHPLLEENAEELLSSANFVFRYQGQFLHEIPEIRGAWQRHYSSRAVGEAQICLVTGQMAPTAQLHPSIKGVNGAQSSGASLVSYNAQAFCSYGKEQGMNAPTGEYAAFAYGAALNHLLSDRRHVFYIGDTALLCWAQGGEPAYQDAFDDFLCSDGYSEQDFWEMARALSRGRPFDFQEAQLDPERPFYVLGLAPNAARLSVRFFLRNTFGHFLKNIVAHQERLRIQRPAYDKNEVLSLWRLLNETVNQNARDKSAAPNLAGELLRAVLEDGRYPATLLNGVQLRIRADRNITRGRAAIIKAYYLKNRHSDVPEEVLTVSLNPESTNTAYLLGRLFSLLENIQSTAAPGLNATIKDRYFNAACATPAHVFPVLLKLTQNHLKVIGRDKGGMKILLEKQLQEVLGQLGEEYPARLTLPQQGSFQLGYYHQTQERYRKKEET